MGAREEQDTGNPQHISRLAPPCGSLMLKTTQTQSQQHLVPYVEQPVKYAADIATLILPSILKHRMLPQKLKYRMLPQNYRKKPSGQYECTCSKRFTRTKPGILTKSLYMAVANTSKSSSHSWLRLRSKWVYLHGTTPVKPPS